MKPEIESIIQAADACHALHGIVAPPEPAWREAAPCPAMPDIRMKYTSA